MSEKMCKRVKEGEEKNIRDGQILEICTEWLISQLKNSSLLAVQHFP